jgi:hypothetical protein
MGGGVSLLVPVLDISVASVGSYARIGEDDSGFEPGIATALFFRTAGLLLSHYVMAGGLLLQARFGLGTRRPR